MSRLLTTVSAITVIAGTYVNADVPKVIADIAPIHSLVSRVMDGVGEPKLIVPNETSPHDYRLRPADAQAIEDANLVFWMGEGLTPWMERALEALNRDTDIVEFLALEESTRLSFREGALFEAHDDHDEHDDHDKEHDDHDDHDDHDKEHDDQDDHDDHDKEHDDHDDHDDHDKEHDDHALYHGEFDPHAWLSTSNAKIWLNVIAAKLSSIDPNNAGIYFANASEARNEIDALDDEINVMLAPVRGGKFIVFHDAYQYFETVYNFPASGAISLGDASDPSAARIAEIANRIKRENIDCVLSEPQFNAGLVETVMGGTDANTQVIDPLGFGIEPGSSLYPKLIRAMAKSLVDCLK
jgi:zinc transport system substrate-binding protein